MEAIMKKIIGMFNVSSTDFDYFNKQFNKNVLILQTDGQEVEVQYSTNIEHCEIVYSALILGRK